MLDLAQETIGLDQLGGHLVLDPAPLGQGGESRASLRQPQLGLATTQNKLLGLGEELDLADAAAADLQVVTEGADGAEAAIGVDLPLDRMDVADRGIIKVLAPEERHQGLQECVARVHVAGHGARLDQRRALPVLAVALVVELGVLAGERQGVARQMRPQPEVGAKDVAVLVPGLQQVDQAARQPDAERHRAFAAAVAQALAVEQDDEVDVAREVELASAQLAHAEHEHPAGFRYPSLDLAAAHPFAQQMVDRLLHRAVGEGGEGRGDPLHRPDAVQIAQADQQGLPPPGATQAGHETRAIVERHRVLLGVKMVQRPLGPLLAQQSQDGGLVAERVAEERAAGEDSGEQRLVAVECRPHERGERGIGRDLGQMPPALQTTLGRCLVGHTRRGKNRQSQAQAPRSARGGAPGSGGTVSLVNPRSIVWPGPLASPDPVVDGGAKRDTWVGTVMRRLLKIVLGLLLVLAVGVGALLWRLDQGPLSLALMQPLLQFLIDRGTPYAIAFSDPKLIWLRDEDAAGLELRNVEARTREGELVAAAPLVRASVAVPPLLLEQRLELVDVTVDLPEIQLTRDEQRKLVLRFDQRLVAVPLGEAAGGGGLGTLLGETGEVQDPRLASLRLVRISAPSLQFVDATTGDRATAANAVFELERKGAVWQAALRGQLGQSTVALSGEPTTTPGRPDVTLQLERLRPKDFVAFAPTVPLAGFDLPVSGTVRLSIDATTATVGAANVDLTMGAGEIAVTSLGLAPIAIKQGELRGTVRGGWAGADVKRLELVADGFALGAAGTVTVVDGNVAADITLDAKELDVAEVLQLWPTTIGSGARDWIRANIAAGSSRRSRSRSTSGVHGPTSRSWAAPSSSPGRRFATSIFSAGDRRRRHGLARRQQSGGQAGVGQERRGRSLPGDGDSHQPDRRRRRASCRSRPTCARASRPS